jgi:hypothetical protein
MLFIWSISFDLQRKNQGFLDLVQNDVNNVFKAQYSDLYVKLQEAAELAGRPDLENAALLLTEVRRALKAAEPAAQEESLQNPLSAHL